jgi:hypothetical protein
MPSARPSVPSISEIEAPGKAAAAERKAKGQQAAAKKERALAAMAARRRDGPRKPSARAKAGKPGSWEPFDSGLTLMVSCRDEPGHAYASRIWESGVSRATLWRWQEGLCWPSDKFHVREITDGGVSLIGGEDEDKLALALRRLNPSNETVLVVYLNEALSKLRFR